MLRLVPRGLVPMFRFRVALAVVCCTLATSSVVPAGAEVRPSRAVPVVVKQAEHCSAYAPADWSVNSDPQAHTMDLKSADGTMYAGWGGTVVDRDKEPYLGPLYGDPETSIRTIAGMIVGAVFSDSSGVRFTSAPEPFLGDFTIRHIASARTQGVAFYHIYPLSQRSYTESVYFAITDASVPKARQMIAPGVAVSIRCATQLIPSRMPDPVRGGKNGKARPGCGGEGNLRSYNAQLGTQAAHSASGTNYLLDPATDLRDGPQGPGYYATAGNSIEKLQLGRSDDGC